MINNYSTAYPEFRQWVRRPDECTERVAVMVAGQEAHSVFEMVTCVVVHAWRNGEVGVKRA